MNKIPAHSMPIITATAGFPKNIKHASARDKATQFQMKGQAPHKRCFPTRLRLRSTTVKGAIAGMLVGTIFTTALLNSILKKENVSTKDKWTDPSVFEQMMVFSASIIALASIGGLIGTWIGTAIPRAQHAREASRSINV
jgi:hypothetical protein